MMYGDWPALVHGLQHNSSRLGLTWATTLATVTDPFIPSIRIDGDRIDLSNEITNVTGQRLLEGDRVTALIVPPNKIFIIGFVKPRDWRPWNIAFENMVVGDGSVLAEYQVMNMTCFYRVKVVFGTGMFMGSAPRFNFPIEPHSNHGDFDQLGWGRLLDASPLSSRQAFVFRSTPTGLGADFSFWNATPTLQGITATAPWTWAAPDEIELEGFYRI